MKGLTVLALISGQFSMVLAGRMPQREALTVLVGDHLGIESSAFKKAVALAREILGKAGLPMQWITCSASVSDGVSTYPCLKEIGTPDLVVRVLPKAVSGNPVPALSMGIAANDGGIGGHAYVYYDRVLRAGTFNNCDAYRVLGHAIAHEIGHLLGSAHSTSGIMGADWNRRTLADIRMDRGYLRFSPDQALRMRANVAARLLELQASRHSPILQAHQRN